MDNKSLHLIASPRDGQPDLRPSSLSADHIQVKASLTRPIKQTIDWHSSCIVCNMECKLLINIKYVGDFWAKMQAIRKEIRKYGWELLGEIVDGKVNPLSAHISCRAMEKIDQIKRDSVLIQGGDKNE